MFAFILKLLFPSIILLVIQILCLRNIYIFRSPIASAYIKMIQSMQFPFITLVWHYNINDAQWAREMRKPLKIVYDSLPLA